MSAKTAPSRREFIRAALATAAVPYVLPTLARGDQAPSARITLGMIGNGNMGGLHLPGVLANENVQVVAVCDVRKWKREEFQRRIEEHYAEHRRDGKFTGVAAYHYYEDVLARPDIDAVLIAVPDHWHAIIAVNACRAGKDVYCEKPLSLTIREADEMVAAARRYARVFQTGSQQRSDAQFRLACELVRSGRIGKVQTVNVGVGEPSEPKWLPEEPIPDGFDYDRWLGPTPWYPHNSERCSGDFGGGWRRIRDYSGGMMTDWGAHHFDIAQWGLGMDGSGPVKIIPPNVADNGQLTYEYANGVKMYRGGANGILFTGTDGKVEVNRGYLRTWPDELGKTPLLPEDVHLYESPGQFQDFVNCVRSRKKPICDVVIGASSVTVCHLGNIASWLGRTLHWDPQRRMLLNDAGAERWLSRPKRAPYHT